MTAAELIQTLAAAGCVAYGSTLVLDREYACPAMDFLQNEFSEDFRKILWEEGLTDWVSEAGDCDNFSVRAMDEAQKAHVKSKNREGNKGLAFGCFFYYPEWAKGAAHCINFAIIREPDGSHQPVFFEPQTGSLFGLRNLTTQEINSCFGYLVC